MERDLARCELMTSLIPSCIKSLADINGGSDVSFVDEGSGDLEAGVSGAWGAALAVGVEVISGLPVKSEDEPKFRGPSSAVFEAEAPRFRFKGLDGPEELSELSLVVLFSVGFGSSVLRLFCPWGNGLKSLPCGGSPLSALFVFIRSHLLFRTLSFHFPLYCLADEGAAGVGPLVSMFKSRPSSIVVRQVAENDRPRNFSTMSRTGR